MPKKYVIGCLVAFILILVISKPTKQECLNKYEGLAKGRANAEFYEKHKDQEKLLGIMHVADASDKYANSTWHNYLSIKDYVLFSVVSFKTEPVGIGILKSFINV